MIKIFRIKAVLRWSILVTGLIFLNMNFFLAEIKALELDKDKRMCENIAKLIATSSTEEEKDVFGSSAEKDNIPTNELDLILHASHFNEHVLLSLSMVPGIHSAEKPLKHFAEIAYPPPKV